MSHASPESDLRSGQSSAYPSPKYSSKSIPTLPPITAGDAAPSHGYRSSHGGPKTAPTSPHALASDPVTGRALKMHSILNPPSHGDDRRASAPDVARRPPELPISPQNHNGPSRTLPPMSGLTSPYGSNGRPSDAADASRRGYPPGAMALSGNNKSPYASTASTPLMGTPNVARPTYGFPGPSAPPSDRRGSDSVTTAPQSLTNSPTTSYSSYLPTQRNSPTGQYAHMAAPSQGGYGPAIVLANDAHHRNGSSTTQSSYQLMTLDTEQGPIQVPVDVQAASKMADEKRKRNAGASARFRQRRKEKEREASQTISRLESQVRDVSEEKEYYRIERDYFRDLVYNSPASAHVQPRMPSPKQRRAGVARPSGEDWQQNGERGSDDGRNQRRRISGYSDAGAPTSGAYPPPPPAAAHGGLHYGYPRPGDRPGAPPTGPPPLTNGHYVPAGPPSYNPAWKPQVS